MSRRRKTRQGGGRVPAAPRSPSGPIKGVTPDMTPVPFPLLIGLTEGHFGPAEMLLILVAFRQAAPHWRMPEPGEDWRLSAPKAPIVFDLFALAEATGYPFERLADAQSVLMRSKVVIYNPAGCDLRINPHPDQWIQPSTGAKRLDPGTIEAIRRINEAYTTPALRVRAPGVSS